MDKQAIYDLTYGVFLLSTKDGDEVNGCITNTCIQAASNPIRVAISVINTNYTCELIKKSGVFAVSVLDKRTAYETVAHFGMQSGRDVDKFGPLQLPVDCNGVPYLFWCSCAVISAKVVDKIDLGSHTLFIGEVVDAEVLSDNAPLTYDDYRNNVKPKPEAKKDDRKIVGWKCRICNYYYEGAELPADYSCPLCGHGAEDFEPVYE